MLNFKDLVDGVKDNKKVDEYLLDFFTKKNFKEYELEDDLEKDDIKAIKVMFESKKGLMERVDKAFTYNPLCVEAFFVFFLLSEDIYVSKRFEIYYNELNNYSYFGSYQKRCYLEILNFYVEFCLDISNVTRAIKIQKTIMMLTNGSNAEDITRLSFMYFTLENEDDYYRLYLDYPFNLYDYLLLIVTLLKHEEELKAREVLQDMYDNIEYSIYLDHAWDLDEKDPRQKEVIATINGCYEDLVSVPNFFSWVNQTREKLSK